MWSWHVKVPPVATFWAPNFTFICSVGTAAIRRLNPLRGDTMLRCLFPNSHRRFLSLPLLGPIAEGFDDWLAFNGYTRYSRQYLISMLSRVDADLRHRQVKAVADLTHPVLYDCWRTLIKIHRHGAGTVRTLERYLATKSLITDGRPTPATSSASILAEEYASSLREVRGSAASTFSNHRYTAQCFLQHLDEKGTALKAIQPSHIESYVTKAGKCLSRASLQVYIGALRGFLRFLAMDGRVRQGLVSQIDTPRVYQFEQLPRTLPWETVRALLRSIDRTSAMGLRDYAMFLLIATYGLRASEVVALTLDEDRKSTRLNSSHGYISYAVFCLKKKKKTISTSVSAASGRPWADITTPSYQSTPHRANSTTTCNTSGSLSRSSPPELYESTRPTP